LARYAAQQQRPCQADLCWFR